MENKVWGLVDIGVGFSHEACTVVCWGSINKELAAQPPDIMESVPGSQPAVQAFLIELHMKA